MNWEAIGAVGELVGASAVFITLIYLAIQIRNANQANRVVTAARIAGAADEWIKQIVQDAELYELYRHGLTDYEPLSPLEKGRFQLLVLQFLRASESTWIQRRLGAVESDLWSGYREVVKFIIGSQGGLHAFKKNREFLSPKFAEAVDEILNKTD